MKFSDESDACRVSGGSSKCPCQDGYEGDPCRGECQSKLELFKTRFFHKRCLMFDQFWHRLKHW